MGEPLDRRSDLFGVGAVLFECLALARMWGDGTDMEIIRKLALEEPPSLPDSAPESMRALYTKLVSRTATERPASAHAVAESLFELVPQGRESAAKEIAKILETHFAAQAEDQRKKLTRSLRESGLPPEPVPVSAKPARAPQREEPKRSSGVLVFASIGLGLVAFLGYAYVQTNRPAPAPSPPSPPAVMTSAPPPVVSSSPAPAASIEPVVSATPKPSAKPPPTASIAVKPKPSAAPPPQASASAKPTDVITNPF